MFEFLIENNPEPVYIYDKENLRFLEVNQAAQDLYQYTKEEFQQLDLTDLYNPEDIQTLLGTSSEQLEEGKFSLPLRQKRKDGSTILVEVSKFSFKFNDRDAHFNIVKNVTDSLELEKNIQLFKAAFDNSTNLIFVTDPEGIIKFVNSSAIDILGFPKQDLENSSFTSLSIDEDRTIINTSIFQSHLKEPVSMVVQLKSADSTLIETEISATPVLDFEKNVDSFVIIGKTQTGKVEEERLSEAMKEVEEKKLPETGSDNSVQLESAFLSGVFHEILTPMNVILGFAQELTEGIDNLTPDQKEAVEIINQNRGKLLSTMNAIIEYSEVQRKKDEWDISEITITKVVEELDKYIYEIIGSRDIEFAYGKISSSLQFSTDKTKFDCLLNNLIRLVSTLCQDNKIYFSSYPVDDDNFIIMLTDSYASASDYLTNTLRKLFIDKREAKEIGVSKLGAQITQSLLDLLKGKFISSIDDSGKYECGFVFPINLMQTSTEETESTIEKPASEVESREPVDTMEQEEQLVQDDVSAHSNEGIEIEEETEIPEKPVETSIPVDTEIQEEKDINQEKIEEQETFQEKFEEPEEIPVEEKAEEPVIEETEKLVGSQEEVEDVDKPKQEPVQSKVEEFSFEDESSNQKFQPSEDKLDLSGLSCLYIEDQVDSQILFKVQMKGLKNIKYAVSFEEA
ncbi:MAG: PAS domain S-box protein, partial [Ignavibacteriaceae bacterium]